MRKGLITIQMPGSTAGAAGPFSVGIASDAPPEPAGAVPPPLWQSRTQDSNVLLGILL